MNNAIKTKKAAIAARIAFLAAVPCEDLSADVIGDSIVIEAPRKHAGKVAAVFGTPIGESDWCDDEYCITSMSAATRAFVRIPLARIERSISALKAALS